MDKDLEEWVALQVGVRVCEKIIEEVGVAKPLKGNYKKAFDTYCKKIDKDINFCKKEYGENDNSIDDLEWERTYAEIVLTFLRDEMGFKLVKNRKV